VEKTRGLLLARLALAAMIGGLATQAYATDVSNYTFNPYAYRTIAPTPPEAAAATPAPPARVVAPVQTPTPKRPSTATLPLPDNGACIGICRVFELMWRLERPGDPAAVPTS